ncbi:MAG: hypothetical protein EZS28_036623 [Streblomastix strix]|uniref:Uncharacterized protein n=1 Tax=Streblomastix strix TaxID=222440 RepID=A0A5J4UBG0_9EUKA|nr:MAG: hypothetical protein EZS28_036623 [Streblomastix strix]
MEKDDAGPAPVEVQEKLKQGKRSRKSKTEGLNASDEQEQRSNANAQTKTTFKVPKPKKRVKGSRIPDRAGTLQPREISAEISPRNRDKQCADEDGSSGDGGKDRRIDIQRKRQWNEEKDQKIYINMETDMERRFHKH